MRTCLLGLFALTAASALADPQLTSWSTANSGKYARVYETTSARTNGTSVTTWGSGSTTAQSLPAYSEVQKVSYSSSWVYVNYTGLASYVMGPWLNPQGGQFQFWPTNRKAIDRFPRNPSVKSGSKNSTPGGYAGLWVNGTAVFNALDGKAWNGSTLVSGIHTSLSYYWHRNAPVAESFNFDSAMGHQPPTAVYHTHQSPNGLRYQLGDHMSYDSSTKLYSESASSVPAHSPILGWAYDGYPIYGPYGYGSAMDSSSTVRRMVSGYARFRQKLGSSYSLTATTSRPSVNNSYPLGTFAEDFDYLGDVGKTQGTDFDLDEYNGRYCVTPEYPNGTYAYFVALDSSNASTYPYVFGFEFYGSATGGTVTSITETVAVQTDAGADTVEAAQIPSANNTSGDVTLTWSSVEGGTYKVEASPDLANWSTLTAVQAAASNATQTSYVDSGGGASNSSRYYRVTRTSTATYDQ